MNTPQEFAPLLQAIRRLEAAGFAGGAALATLVRTQGSTFRRAGARMLVLGDGTVVRGLSGGCPEADIVARASRVIAADLPELVHYQGDNIFDPMIEAGCGGDIEVLIEPINRKSDLMFVEAVARCLEAREAGCLATVYARDGQCLHPRPRRLVWKDKGADGDLDDKLLKQAVVEQIEAVGPAQPAARTLEVAGGSFDVLIEPLRPPHALVLVGASAVSIALAQLGLQLGWLVTLVDSRPDAPAPPGLPAGVQFRNLEIARLCERLTLDTYTSIVVMSHKLDTDIACLKALRDAPVGYLGAIGSRMRVTKVREETGLSPPRLRAPAGLDVGSETPEEIALSIAAEIVAVTAGREGGALSAVTRPIH